VVAKFKTRPGNSLASYPRGGGVAWNRFWTLIIGVWGLELLSQTFTPALRWIWDPLFLVLLLIGLTVSKPQSVWRWGALLGLLKDLAGGGLFGSYLCAYAAIGCLLGLVRPVLEREDPLARGVWTALLTFAKEAIIVALVWLADPEVIGSWSWWWIVPVSMGVHGWIIGWGLPRLRPLLMRRRWNVAGRDGQ